MSYQDRRRAGSFGDDADQYDRARPAYPNAMISDLVLQFVESGGDGGRVLDVGCGTGIVGRLFRDRGCAVLGVEADRRMAAVAQRHGIEVDVVPFESWAQRGRRYDLVVSGQAWHWVDPAVGPRKAGEVLRAGGALAVFWNSYRYEPAFRDAMLTAYHEVAPDLADNSVALGTIAATAGAAERRADVAAIAACGLFAPSAERSYAWHRRRTRDEWIDELATHSGHRVADPGVFDRLVGRLADLVDLFGGTVEIEMQTELLLSVRAT